MSQNENVSIKELERQWKRKSNAISSGNTKLLLYMQASDIMLAFVSGHVTVIITKHVQLHLTKNSKPLICCLFDENLQVGIKPKVVVFDLNGCLLIQIQHLIMIMDWAKFK